MLQLTRRDLEVSGWKVRLDSLSISRTHDLPPEPGGNVGSAVEYRSTRLDVGRASVLAAPRGERLRIQPKQLCRFGAIEELFGVDARCGGVRTRRALAAANIALDRIHRLHHHLGWL